MAEKALPDLPTAGDGSKLLPSYQKNADGSARFVMVLPAAYDEDPGLSILARCEALHSGYEYPYRQFLDRNLEAGDLFIDIGPVHPARYGALRLGDASGRPQSGAISRRSLGRRGGAGGAGVRP